MWGRKTEEGSEWREVKPGRKNRFPYSLSWFVKVHAVFSVEEVKFCLSGLMKTQECVRKWCFYLVFRISSQHRIKGCCALRSVLFPMEKKIKLQHFQKFRCIPENLSGVVWLCCFSSCYEFDLKWPPKSVNSLAKQLLLPGPGWKPQKPTEFCRNSCRSQNCSDMHSKGCINLKLWFVTRLHPLLLPH